MDSAVPTTLLRVSLLMSLMVGVGCDDSEEAPVAGEQALVAATDWMMGADPGLGSQPRGRLNWFPRSATLDQQEIHPGWPHNEPMTVMTLVHQPFAFLAGSTVHHVPDSWTSMTSLATLDTLTLVLEWKMLYESLHNAGTLVVDIGEFSEDVVPNGILGFEVGTETGHVMPGEDTGLDGMSGVDVPWPLPVELMGWTGTLDLMQAQFGEVYDWQDLNFDLTRQTSEPWSLDDWSAANEDDPTAGNPCGAEHNSWDIHLTGRDSEDLDGDGVLDTAENFLRYTFPLDPDNPTRDAAITQLANSDWLQLSLQLEREHTVVGTPDLDGPVRVRVSLAGFNGPAILHLTWFDWR